MMADVSKDSTSWQCTFGPSVLFLVTAVITEIKLNNVSWHMRFSYLSNFQAMKP